MMLEHKQLLADKIRNEAFRRAIQTQVSDGQIVCDLGCGSGIMGFFAMQAGASTVYGIDRAKMIEGARAIARENGYDDNCHYFAGKSSEVKLPERCDWIIVEWLSSFGADEVPLGEIRNAVASFLKPDGGIIPRYIEHFAMPVEDAAVWESCVGIWHRPLGGLDFSSIAETAALRDYMRRNDPDGSLANPGLWLKIDYLDESSHRDQSLFEGESLSFEIGRSGLCHGLATWFVADLGGGIRLSTAPEAPETHWKNLFLPFEKALKVEEGDRLDVQLGSRLRGSESEIFWNVRHSRKGRHLSYCGSPGHISSRASMADLARISGAFIPRKSNADRRLKALLGLVDGRRNAIEVAGLAVCEHADLFSSERDALEELIELWRKRPFDEEI